MLAAMTFLVALAAPAKAQSPPECPAGTPSSLRFAGLRDAIPYGPDEFFALDYDDFDWDVVGPVRIIMASGGSPFFDDETYDELAELYVQLDLGDPPVNITAMFVQEDSTVDEPTQCLQRIYATVSGYRDFRIIDRCDYPSAEPRWIIIACGDGNLQLGKLSWNRWNKRAATARGNAYANDCDPYCAAGDFHAYPVKLRAYRARQLGRGHYTYTRLRVTYLGRRPTGARRVLTYKAGEDQYGFYWH
jgi:hypothetical protein